MLKLWFIVFSPVFFWLKHAMRLMCLLAVVGAITVLPVQAEDAWYPVKVDVWNPPFNDQRQREEKLYTPLERAQKKWRIHVFIPHLKDDYWLGVNYGLIHEARRLEVSLSIFEAGGYNRLEVQRRQIENAIAENPDGLIIGGISLDGLNDLVKKASDKGIPVLDLINGISSPHVAARAAVSFWDMGFQAGSYLHRMQESSGQPLKVAWFPGPDGAGWVKAGDAGLRSAIEVGAIEILDTRYGDTGSAAQIKLVEATLSQYANDLDIVAGTAVTAEAAVKILRRRGLVGKIKIISYYYSPGVHRGILRGDITAAPSDLTVLQARIAVDVMVRILEKRAYFKHVAPRVTIVDHDNIRSWDSSTTLAPRGFRPIFSINE